MDLKLKHTADSILDHEFSANKPGYDALEVDSFLDEIVSDYIATKQYIGKCESKIKELEKEKNIFKTKNDKLEVENALLNEKFKYVSNNTEASLSNLDLLKRISALENALYKLGKDPSEIK